MPADNPVQNLTVINHPLIQHKLTILRDKTTPSALFRQALREIAVLLGYEATRDLSLDDVEIETPLEKGRFANLPGGKVCLVSILRAGNGLLDGMLDLIPNASVGHIGMQRDEETLEPENYYFNMPSNLAEKEVYLLDPMLATGGSAIAAATSLKAGGVRKLKFICLVAAPEGGAAFTKAHPEIPVITAALDRQLNEIGYILPGLGDAGDRIYATDT